MMADNRDAADRAAYEATGNPLFVWAAIGRYAAGEPLPVWIRSYLMQTTRALLQLQLDSTVSPTEAAERTAQALRLVSKGRNRFAEARQLREDSFDAAIYTLGVGKGQSDSWAAEVGAARNPGAKMESNVRNVFRRAAKVRRIFGR
jgi:hypothetical protein